MRHTRLIVSAACLSLVLAVSFLTASSSGDHRMETSESRNDASTLFARLDALWLLPSLTPPAVEEVIGMRLTTATPAAAPPAPRVFKGTAGDGLFASAELRLPAEPGTSPAGLLILALRPESALTAEQVVKRYGDATAVEPPHPGAPPETPVYYRYVGPEANGVLSFGIREGRVVRVVLDRYPQ
jgi:hypothetical protein